MNNLIKCNRCGELLSSEFEDEHVCTIPLKDIKEIFIDHFVETKTANKEQIIIAKGLDGIIYRLIVSKTKTFSTYPTDFDSKNNRRRLDRTFKRSFYIEPQTLFCKNHIPIFE